MFVLTQLSLKAGIREQGEEAEAPTAKEMRAQETTAGQCQKQQTC